MKKNDFSVNTEVSPKKNFLKRTGGLFEAAIILTGICSVAGIVFPIQGIRHGIWQDIGMAAFVTHELYYLIMLLAFVMLIKIAVDEKPFSVTLTRGIRAAGILLLAASVIIPRLQGYQLFGLVIFSNGRSALIDGNLLLPGILLVILGNLVKAGFDMQKEMDEIL